MSAKAWDPRAALTSAQREQLETYEELLAHFNQRINLVARTDEDNICIRHVTHCLALICRTFPPGSTVVDWGTGGGLPAIPLAIAFPEVHFVAVDAVNKKVQAVAAMARRLGLDNLEAWHGRAEAWPDRLHYSVSRATAPLRDLWGWHARAVIPIEGSPTADEWHPGLVCLKGGDLTEEIEELQQAFPGVRVSSRPLNTLLSDPFFAEKCIVEVQI